MPGRIPSHRMADTVVPPTGPTQFVIDAGHVSTVGSAAQINITSLADSLRTEITWAPDGSGDARTPTLAAHGRQNHREHLRQRHRHR